MTCLLAAPASHADVLMDFVRLFPLIVTPTELIHETGIGPAGGATNVAKFKEMERFVTLPARSVACTLIVFAPGLSGTSQLKFPPEIVAVTVLHPTFESPESA